MVSVQAPLQSVKPGAHLHLPAAHEVPPVHTWPQPPQSALLDVVSVQTLPQSSSPAPHEQVPPVQAVFPTHTAPHEPQLRLSQHLATQPPPHRTSPGGHSEMQLPCEQTFLAGQPWSQEPQ